MARSEVTKEGLLHTRPDREAIIGANAGPRGDKNGGRESVVPRPSFESYYGLPVLNKPTWEPLDIAGYLFLGGLAGSSSTLAAAARLTGRDALARPLERGAAVAIGLSFVALVHDLGRPSRFYNMLRVFKPSSPMSVGSWLLTAYGPAAMGAAALTFAPFAAVPTFVSRTLTMAAGATGPAVATYTAVLLSDTAVPAWHDGHKDMPFVFAASASSAGAGLGLMTAPLAAAGPARRLGAAAAGIELAASRYMRSRLGLAAEAYEKGKPARLMKAAEALTAAGAVGAVAGRRSRLLSGVAGACLIAGSACTRFAVFHAGVESAADPRYTIEGQASR